jgi:sugar/nucleoside kinase (ribokinase family)
MYFRNDFMLLFYQMHDFIAIGDIVTDAFIKLKDASVHCKLDTNECEICMPFAEKIPYDSVEEISAVGNSPNAAVSASRLGLKSALVTNLGGDIHGEKALQTLNNDKVDTKFIKVHQDKKTNYHYVLWYENDRTILVKHEDYEYRLPDMSSPKWLYLSSLGSNTDKYHGEITEYLKAHPEVNLAFQPGTFQIKLGKGKLSDIYKRTKIFFCNIEEAERILGINTLGIQELLKRMRELGPEIMVITDGPKGAYAYDGSQMLFQPPYPDQAPAFERTGAGDAFASTCVASLALGNDLPTALKWGSVNAMSVVQQVGAQKGLLTSEQLESFLASASADFQTKAL